MFGVLVTLFGSKPSWVYRFGKTYSQVNSQLLLFDLFILSIIPGRGRLRVDWHPSRYLHPIQLLAETRAGWRAAWRAGWCPHWELPWCTQLNPWFS